MTDKFRQAWAEIEEAIGGCALHKKAAANEIMGEPLQQLTLVTTAPMSVIDAFIGKRKVEKSQANRYQFSHNGVRIDLTTFCDIEDLDELHAKSFRHTLSIESIGISRDGRISDTYGGVSDLHNRVVRVTNEKAVVSETTFRRILQLVLQGYTLDASVHKRFESGGYFGKESYRKKYCEELLSALNSESVDWKNIAALLDALGSVLDNRKTIVKYTENIKNNTPEFKRTFAFLIFAFIKVTGKELLAVMKNDKQANMFDSLCVNLSNPIESHADYRQRKEKYGEEFLEVLFDMQELWMTIEGIPYKRPSERDFDRMALLMADDRFWSTTAGKVHEEVVDEAGDSDEEEYALHGSLDFNHATGDYHSEDYEDETEGIVVDDYEPAEEREIRESQNSDTSLLDILDEEDESSSVKSGLNCDALDDMEAQIRGASSPPAPTQRTPKGEGFFSRPREHRSKVLNTEL